MGMADELRKQLDETETQREAAAELENKRNRERLEKEAEALAPVMLKRCLASTRVETAAGGSRSHMTFDGTAAQWAADRVAEELRKENFNVTIRNDSYGFRMDSEGYTLNEGTPYVAFVIEW